MPETLSHIDIHIFADWHIGDSLCKEKLIKQRIDTVKNDPNSYCVINGDVLNWATRHSVSDIYAEKLTPTKQVDTLTELLAPIKDKILYMTKGNHENRSYRSDGIDVLYLAAKDLRITDRYSGEGSVLFVRLGKNNKNRKILYTIYAQHGAGGGRKEGAKMIRLADMATVVNTDIYIHSHTHLPAIMGIDRFEVNPENSIVLRKEMLFVNSSATLKYGGYAQANGYKPASLRSPVIHLSGTEKHFTATL